jgi:tRNA dimethylallyltransferase
MFSNKTCIVIAGPTAVGKTSLAISLAKHFSTEIISADSRQCFKELNIGVAKPSKEELLSVPHHFINHLSITEEFSVADYEVYSLNKLKELFNSKDVVIVCGGTGLYLKALTTGLDKIPAVPDSIRLVIRNRAKLEGIEWAQQILAKEDPVFAATESYHNTNRVLRALEVFDATGKPISHFQNSITTKRDFDIVQICLDLPREQLYERINKRVDVMIKDGLVEEANSLLKYRNLNALNTVGYKELFSYLDKEISLETAVGLIKQHTRQYAKRQKTWFSKVDDMQFLKPGLPEILSFLLTK